MDDFELFGTEEEALAFVKGLEAATGAVDGEVYSEIDQTLTTGEWQVNFVIKA